MKPGIIGIVFTIFIVAGCKKEKPPEPAPAAIADYSHVSYEVGGVVKNMQAPLYNLGWTNFIVYLEFHQYGVSGPQPKDGFEFTLTGRMDTLPHLIKRNDYSRFRISYVDSNSMRYNLQNGSFGLSKIDSMNCIYKGKFEGMFVKQDNADSFEAKKGDFYFKKPF